MTQILDQLRAELLPVVREARRTAPAAGWLTVRIGCDPLSLAVVLHDDLGETGTFVVVPTDGLAEAVASFLSDLPAALPASQRRVAQAYVAQRPEAITLLTDAALRDLHVLLDPGGDADLIELGVLTDETRH